MSARAGIVVTGTEVLTGRVSDRNGPWLAERLRELGVDLAFTAIVGDRREDMEAALRFMADRGMDVVITSGGLGPTADDLTAEVVGRFQGRPMVLDPALERRIAEILEPLMKRWPDLDRDAVRESNRKQAVIPDGSTVLDPVGTAPGLVVPPAEPDGGPTIVVLPGPPRELQPMWAVAVETPALKAAVASATTYRQRMLRMFGIPESEIALTLREAESAGVDLGRLEVTTCLKRGEVEVVTRYEPASEETYEAFERVIRERHADTLFSDDGSTVDEQVASMMRADGLTLAVAESCTGGLLAARLTELAGSSDYFKGGIVAYSNEVKVALAAVPPELIERHGAVSQEVAEALADGSSKQLETDVGVGVTGVAGPGGGTESKPVGLVWISVAGPGEERLTRSINLPGGRFDVRDRATTVAMHLLRRALLAHAPAARLARG
ncbi:MAG TPA: competence/damage-inducible protein A [Solirubrobacteraceae bacterium]|jgi:nicotinamide-nucleotide amidase|nr:competence/damage-inducible protein A [Solirubrobacteraceae bacterium]